MKAKRKLMPVSDDDFLQFLVVCKEKAVPPLAVLRPNEYREKHNVQRRAIVMKRLRAEGWDIHMLRALTKLSERSIRRALNKEVVNRDYEIFIDRLQDLTRYRSERCGVTILTKILSRKRL